MDENQQIEVEARRQGWRPKEEFSGDPSVWVDAKQFVERGKEILPRIQKHSARLEQENAALKQQQAAQAAELAEMRQQVVGLTEFNAGVAARERERIRAEITAELAAARQSGDVQKEVAALAKLSAPVLPPPPPARAPAPPPALAVPAQLPQEMNTWVAANPWYQRDPVLQNAMNIVSAELRANGALVGMDLTESLNATAREVLKRYAPPSLQPAARVEGGGGSSRGGPQNLPQTGTFDSLPAHLKEECDRQGQRLGLIGEKKAFKTLDAWRQHYVNQTSRYAEGVGYDYKPPGN